MADDVEVPADEAMSAAGEATPVDDPSADADAAATATAEEAGDAAAAAAADVEAAAGEASKRAGPIRADNAAASRSCAPLALLAGCGSNDTDPGPGGVTVAEAKALDEAAEMIDARRPPPEALKEGASAAPSATESPAPAPPLRQASRLRPMTGPGAAGSAARNGCATCWACRSPIAGSPRSTCPAADEGAMPQGIHWCLGVPETPTARLGPDGHPLRDGAPDSFLPPIPAPRRMWAGSALTFHSPIAIGAAIERTSRIETIAEKDGASGKLTFLTLRHETHADGAPAVSEQQTLVYRDAPPPGSPPTPPPPGEMRFDDGDWDTVEWIVPGLPLLFRYSALTFNTHRIHYDADYVREVESYRGPVVHGPLMASLLLQLAARSFGENALRRFAFRAVSPAIADEELVLALRGPARCDRTGRVCGGRAAGDEGRAPAVQPSNGGSGLSTPNLLLRACAPADRA